MQNGLLLAKLRTTSKLTYNEMAKISGVSLSTYKEYESCIRPMKLETLNEISNYFKISLDCLLNISTQNKINTLSDIDYKYLRFSLKFHRRRNRITQGTLAHEFNLSKSTLQKYENNPLSVPITYLYQFAQKFHLSIDYICGKTLEKEVL